MPDGASKIFLLRSRRTARVCMRPPKCTRMLPIAPRKEAPKEKKGRLLPPANAVWVALAHLLDMHGSGYGGRHSHTT